MNSTMKKATCRALVISLLALSFQSAHAGLIGAEQAAPSPSTERSLLLSTLDRAEVAAQLQSAGVDPNAARTRVATMSDQEVQAMTQDIQAAPAGAMSSAGWIAVVLIAGLIWYFAYRK